MKKEIYSEMELRQQAIELTKDMMKTWSDTELRLFAFDRLCNEFEEELGIGNG